MQKVTEHLNRFLHLVPKDKKVKDIALEVLARMFPTVSQEDIVIEFQNGILFTRGTGALRYAIQLKKTEVLAAINKKTSALSVKDIR